MIQEAEPEEREYGACNNSSERTNERTLKLKERRVKASSRFPAACLPDAIV